MDQTTAARQGQFTLLVMASAMKLEIISVLTTGKDPDLLESVMQGAMELNPYKIPTSTIMAAKEFVQFSYGKGPRPDWMG